MFLTVHAPAGALLGVLFGNPFFAFIFGVLSHFFLDAIPHGDREVREWLEKKQYKKYFAVVVTDFFLLGLELAVLYWWFNHEKITSPFPLLEKERVVLVGIIGAILPDFTFPAWWVSRWMQGKHGLAVQPESDPATQSFQRSFVGAGLACPVPPAKRDGTVVPALGRGFEYLLVPCVAFHNRLHKLLYQCDPLTLKQGLFVQLGFWFLLVFGLYLQIK